jgi:antitoxin component of MazEF toxin-antitoxin module
MPFVKRLTRIGSSTGLIIDRPFLQQIDLTPDSEVEVSVEGDALVIRPHRYASEEEFVKSAKRMGAKHRQALKWLADK